jgi:hypothetical protein
VSRMVHCRAFVAAAECFVLHESPTPAVSAARFPLQPAN